MNKKKMGAILIVGVAFLGTVGSGAAVASTASTPSSSLSVFEIAGQSDKEPTDGISQPNAPVLVAMALARGFTAAKAPAAVSQVTRQGGFLQAIGLLASPTTTSGLSDLEDTYFDK